MHERLNKALTPAQVEKLEPGAGKLTVPRLVSCGDTVYIIEDTYVLRAYEVNGRLWYIYVQEES